MGVGASFFWTYLGAFVGGAWTMLVGTVAATLYPGADVASALRAAADALLPGFGTPLLLCSLLALVTVTSLNFYGRWNWRGLAAYGAGFAAMIAFFSTGIYMGPLHALCTAPIWPCWWDSRFRLWSICGPAIRSMSRRIGAAHSRPMSV